MRAASGECDGRLQRRIASADNERVLPGKFLRIEKTVVNFVELFAGNTELAEISAAPDRDDGTTRRDRRLVVLVQEQFATPSFDPFDPGGSHFDSGSTTLLFHFRDQRFLNVGGKLQTAVELHLRGIGVDWFCFREVDDRGKNFGRFEDREIQSRLFRFDRRRNAGDARTDDREIKQITFRFPVSAFRFPKIRLAQNRSNRLRAGVGRKLQQRNAGEITDDPHARLSSDTVRTRKREASPPCPRATAHAAISCNVR